MKKYLALILLVVYAWAFGRSPAPSFAQTPVAISTTAQNLFAALTPEQRIGQLFLVTFNGSKVVDSSDIAQLMKDYAIGGVVLNNQRDNFTAGEESSTDLRALISTLQTYASVRADTKQQPFLPLLIGIAQGGNGFVANPLRNGLTPLPSALALGATWNPEHARTVGSIAGSELSQLGFNLLIAPNLDVLATPKPYSSSDPQAAIFGGNPFWVSSFAKAYVAGLHTGSKNRLAVVAPNFPGLGAGDRSTVSDIPTVTDSLSLLRDKDLLPFFGVMGATAAGNEVLDGIQIPHARYAALQGAGTTNIPPLGVDTSALRQLFTSLPEVQTWRYNGGLVITSSLGQARVRLFYDPTGATFPAFTIARDALLAGNDMLLLDEFGLRPQDQPKTIRTTLEQFLRKYQEDPSFAEGVDAAVLRILAFKLRLFPTMSLADVLPDDATPPPSSTRQLLTIASDASTLLSPSANELAQRLPRSPGANDNLVFLVDDAAFQQCSKCPVQSDLQVKDFEQVVARLYGADGTAQIQSVNLASYSFTELDDFLTGKSLNVTDSSGRPGITEGLKRATWLIVLLRAVNSDKASENPLHRFLRERPDLLKERKVVIFALNAPYYLDATEVSQLTAYFGLYSHTAPFIEVAARLLFKELVPRGASPVSVDATAYDLETQLRPNPTQNFNLLLDENAVLDDLTTPLANRTAGPDATAAAPSTSNRTKQLITSQIRDYNGNLVPDGTFVEFVVTYLSEGQLTKVFAKNATVNGVARATLAIERAGLIEIQAQAGDAFSQKLQFNVTNSSVQVMQTPINELPSPTPLPVTATATLPPATPMPPVTPTPRPPLSRTDHVNGLDLFSAMLAGLVLGFVGWRISNSRGQAVSSGVKIALLVMIGVWVSYIYYTLGGPGVAALSSIAAIAPTLFAWVGGLLGLGLGWLLFKTLAR